MSIGTVPEHSIKIALEFLVNLRECNFSLKFVIFRGHVVDWHFILWRSAESSVPT